MRRQYIIVLAVFFACCIGATVKGSEIYFEDGNTHVINYSIDSYVYIDRNKPGLGTRLELIQGAVLKHGFVANEDSRVTVNGGSVVGSAPAVASGRSIVDIFGGSTIKEATSRDNAKFNIYGGFINDSLNSHNDSEVSIYDGQIYMLYLWEHSFGKIEGGNISYAAADADSQMTINSGNIGYDLQSYGHAKVNFTGGSIGRFLGAFEDSDIVISGGSIQSNIFAGGTESWDASTITIVGSNFAINGVPVSNGRYFASDYSSGLLSGTFASGESFNNSFYIYDAASINLVPEPGTILLMGLGAAILRRKSGFPHNFSLWEKRRGGLRCASTLRYAVTRSKK